jgi:hypothetical protein
MFLVSLLWTLGASGASSKETTSLHWAFQPITNPVTYGNPVALQLPVPSPLDRYIQARLQAEGIAPVGPADRTTLIRRATLDLTGLPPTPQEISSFVSDELPGAFSRVVDRLLASPRYGERWGRHWMDVVRYADTAGDNADYPVPELYRYRDYIINAFASDKPYDRFIEEQLAGDILARGGSRDAYAEGIVATGFLALSRRYGTGPYELWHLTLENAIETVGQAFLGLNLKCARCHDHKFDPISMRDYYGLYGIFASTEFPWAGSEEILTKQFNRQKFVPLLPESEAAPIWEGWVARVTALKEVIARVEQENPTEPQATEDKKRRLSVLKQELRTLEKPGGPAALPMAYAVREGQSQDVPIQKSGDPAKPGEIVPRCVPAVLLGRSSFQPAPGASGRLEFARWLTQPGNPLTARVMVNRIWQHHFGSGLVTTPNNLGVRSDPPVHQDVLDYLATQFVANGWSVKSMHRLIMNSAAYQRASVDLPASRERDPANRFLWRFSRQRLDAESLRDAWLFIAGELDLEHPGPHPFPGPADWGWTQHNPFKDRYESKHRSVYLMTQRFQKHPFLSLFDGPDTNNSTEARRVSTVPQQALFAMNNSFLEERALALARRILGSSSSETTRISNLTRLVWGRPPVPDETTRFARWLEEARLAIAGDPDFARLPDPATETWAALARVVLTSNEFLYVD